MRAAQEAREKAALAAGRHQAERRQRELEARRAALEAQIAALRSESSALEQEGALLREQETLRERLLSEERAAAAMRRGADAPVQRKGKGK
jgi:hypothetical protein